MVSNRSKLPINPPAFFMLLHDFDSPTSYFLSNNLMKILVGFIQIRVAISKIGIEKFSHWSIRCIGHSI